MMIEALAHASLILERKDYYRAAKKAANYITQNMLTKDRLYRASYKGNIGVEAQLADYGGLGLALLALETYNPSGQQNKKYMKMVERLADELQQRFGKPWAKEPAPFRMTETKDGIGTFPPLDDNPIPSGNALALKLLHALAEKNGNPQQKKKTLLLASALSGHALSNPQMRGVLVNAVNATSNGNTGFIRDTAKGNVKVTLKLNRETKEATLNITIRPGWHINSNAPLEDYLIPTQITKNGQKLEAKQFPKPKIKSLSFNKEKLSLYEGVINIMTEFPPSKKQEASKLALKLQACSDQVCLAPEVLEFNFWQ